jgi:predicted TIM-barrel fold metal-dependent hydrolase
MKHITILGTAFMVSLALLNSCGHKPDYYSVSDFKKVPKTDVHFHYNTTDIRYLKYADSLKFRLISPNVDTEMPIDSQLYITSRIKKQFPDQFAFFGTFSIDSFGMSDFTDKTIDRIKKCIDEGACGIKIWKNIGMVLKDTSGRYVMVDDRTFDPVFSYLETNNIPVIAHLGEPRNCWLPEKDMTVDNDRRYYIYHPEYYMYMHPEAPSYEDQINARDNLLKKHPKLIFTGAHLASLEWNVDELAKRFDQFPNLTADLAARMVNLQYQSLTNRERVRNFLIKYQDRILYGSDMTISGNDKDISRTKEGLGARWREHWVYLATDSTIIVRDLGNKEVKGLQLPKEVVDKIFCKNASRFFEKRSLK